MKMMWYSYTLETKHEGDTFSLQDFHSILDDIKDYLLCEPKERMSLPMDGVNQFDTGPVLLQP